MLNVLLLAIAHTIQAFLLSPASLGVDDAEAASEWLVTQDVGGQFQSNI